MTNGKQREILTVSSLTMRLTVCMAEKIALVRTLNKLVTTLLHHALKSSKVLGLLGKIDGVNMLSSRSLQAEMPSIEDIFIDDLLVRTNMKRN